MSIWNYIIVILFVVQIVLVSQLSVFLFQRGSSFIFGREESLAFISESLGSNDSTSDEVHLALTNFKEQIGAVDSNSSRDSSDHSYRAPDKHVSFDVSNNNMNKYKLQPVFNMMHQAVDYNDTIFLDWTRASNDLSYVNYKALEALIFLYPNAKFRFLLVAPQLANHYKWGNRVSKQQFQKYQKRGVDIDVEVVHINPLSFSGYVSDAGDYWDEHYSKCCTYRSPKDIQRSKVAPYHFQMFVLFAHLFLHGGAFTDLSWYHTGAVFHRSIPAAGGRGTPGIAMDQLNGHNSKVKRLFKGKRGFDKLEGFLSFPICHTRFANINTSNSTELSSESYNNRNYTPYCNATTFSSLLKFQAPRSPGCVLEKYDRKRSMLRSCLSTKGRVGSSRLSKRDMLEGYDCVQTAVERCFEAFQQTNIFTAAPSNTLLTSTPGDSNSVMTSMVTSTVPVVTFEKLSFQSEYALWHLDSNGQLRGQILATPGVYWLGGSAVTGNWKKPTAGSVLGMFIEQMDMHTFKSSVTLTNGAGWHSTSSSTVLLDTSYVNTWNIPLFTNPSPGCSPYSTTALHDAATINRAKDSCSISFVVPGFMKAGTTYLFDTLSKHPQVLKALRGNGFKETGCYFPSTLPQDRLDCFPFVQPKEPTQIFGDGTVYYIQREGIPQLLLMDNPKIKTIISVRHPIERFNHKAFAAQSFSSINEMVIFALQDGSPLRELERLANIAASSPNGSYQRTHAIKLLVEQYHDGLAGSKGTELLQNIVQRTQLNSSQPIPDSMGLETLTRKYIQSAQIVLHSIYFPGIYYWHAVLPSHSVVVVPIESLKPPKHSGDHSSKLKYEFEFHQFQQRWNHLYGFLGICQLNETKEGFEHKTNSKRKNLKLHTLHTSVQDMLVRFFKPFQTLLSEQFNRTDIQYL